MGKCVFWGQKFVFLIKIDENWKFSFTLWDTW